MLSISRDILTTSLSELLCVDDFKDYCPNGLQVEGKKKVSKIILGVTASQALIDEAILKKADAIIVHHGLFWQGDEQPIVGIKKQRLQKLLVNDINLYAYHLPLDCHSTLGNNAQIAMRFQLEEVRGHKVSNVDNLLWTGKLLSKQTINSFKKLCEFNFDRAPLYLGRNDKQRIQTIAWCSGAAQKYITEAHALGADLYLSGEASEQTLHLANELGIHYLACGHHATERFGLQALAKQLQKEFSLNCEFLDLNNPI